MPPPVVCVVCNCFSVGFYTLKPINFATPPTMRYLFRVSVLLYMHFRPLAPTEPAGVAIKTVAIYFVKKSRYFVANFPYGGHRNFTALQLAW